ncbi:hypothetical protein BC938DRAFT_479066 [Jimgerdemannia flammicorona]|uniref:Zn(2)-C6 fungal-type domain-containing protein n=1 Tax=Jimgerdemannia flammicorona TaxID=994334 RepID=A0A433QLN5_9FUNG|nr:hypothetical protein BC938DRAFT_479066 [Jimgerdemannia flammicorona]
MEDLSRDWEIPKNPEIQPLPVSTCPPTRFLIVNGGATLVTDGNKQAKLPRARQACDSCNRAHRKCVGKSPCQRCVNQGRECTFNRPQRRTNPVPFESETITSTTTVYPISDISATSI